MKPDRWQQIERLYHSALKRDANERAMYLRQACAGDDGLRQEVESLLAHEKTTDMRLGGSALKGITAKIFGGDSSRSLVGKQFGPHQILSLLGAGGMGEVYEARDTRLGRNVAIKVLPAAFIDDPERLSRFQREARMLAALNHPNIATIHGFEQSDGVHYLVMELVTGQTLAERLQAGPLRMEEALKIASQIVDALEAAHEKGLVHRDLKPANVKVMPEGRVKVLDFGLAKAFADGGEVNLSEALTLSEEGRILGTPSYMSPEQARGKTVDKRTDIWAFGCVLFEMLSGSMAFSGETVSDTIAAVLEREPPWDRLSEATSPIVHRLLRRCLEKDAKRRLRDIGDARLELEDALATPAQDYRGSQKPIGMTRRQVLGALAGVAVGAASTGIFVIRSRDQTRKLTQFAIAVPEGEFFPASFNKRVAISPDGTRIAFNTVAPGTRLIVNTNVPGSDALYTVAQRAGIEARQRCSKWRCGIFFSGRPLDGVRGDQQYGSRYAETGPERRCAGHDLRRGRLLWGNMGGWRHDLFHRGRAGWSHECSGSRWGAQGGRPS